VRFNNPSEWFGPKRNGLGYGPRTWEGWVITLLIPILLMVFSTLRTGSPGHWGPTGFHP
jgi:hypothetical protein